MRDRCDSAVRRRGRAFNQPSSTQIEAVNRTIMAPLPARQGCMHVTSILYRQTGKIEYRPHSAKSIATIYYAFDGPLRTRLCDLLLTGVSS